MHKRRIGDVTDHLALVRVDDHYMRRTRYEQVMRAWIDFKVIPESLPAKDDPLDQVIS